MQARPNIHPSADVLAALGQGKLNETAAEAVEEVVPSAHEAGLPRRAGTPGKVAAEGILG